MGHEVLHISKVVKLAGKTSLGAMIVRWDSRSYRRTLQREFASDDVRFSCSWQYDQPSKDVVRGEA
jgi:hypothetical protein